MKIQYSQNSIIMALDRKIKRFEQLKNDERIIIFNKMISYVDDYNSSYWVRFKSFFGYPKMTKEWVYKVIDEVEINNNWDLKMIPLRMDYFHGFLTEFEIEIFSLSKWIKYHTIIEEFSQVRETVSKADSGRIELTFEESRRYGLHEL